MLKGLWAGVVYAVAVFGFAFLTGALRTVALTSTGAPPVLGVAIELPVLVLVSWAICGLLLQRMHVPAEAGVRLLMGAVALIVMLSGEFALSALVIGRSLPDFLASYEHPEAILGLIGQLAFAAFPVIRMRR